MKKRHKMAARVEVSSAQKVADHELEEKLGLSAIHEARLATEAEHAQTLWQALSENRNGVFWSVLISLSIIMEGLVTLRVPWAGLD